VDDRVAVTDTAVDAVDDRRRDELIVLAAGVGRLDRRRSGRRALPHPMDDRVVAARRALPALVAVHGVVAAADRRDPGIRMGGRETRLEIPYESQGRAWRRVAAVEKSVNADLGDAVPGSQLGEGDEVAVVGVDAARSDQAHDVQAAARSGPDRPFAGVEERRAAEEGAVRDRGVDARQVLEDWPARPEVQVADLGVAYRSRRQAGRLPGRPEGYTARQW